MAGCLKKCCINVPQRYLVCGLIFTAAAISIMDRQAYFQAVHTMVYIPTAVESKSECPAMIDNKHTSTRVLPTSQSRFYWDHKLLRAVTQAMYIGLLISNVPAGCVADHYGGRDVLAVGVLVGSVTTLLLPSLAPHGPVPMIFVRFVQGIGQGLVFSSTHSLIAQWAPTPERSRFVGIIRSGGALGWGLGHVLSRMFSTTWQTPFYLTGSLGLLWFLAWYHFSRSNPSSSVYITDAELQYILSNREGLDGQIKLKRLNVPWKAVFTSSPVLSLLLINWAFSWTHYTMNNQFSYYAVSVLRVTNNLSEMSVFATGFVNPISAVFWGFINDYLINHKYMSRTANRKIVGFTCNMVMIICLLGIPLAGCNSLTAFSINVLLCYCRGIFFSTIYAQPVDLSPRHAGLLMALLNSTGVVTALFSREMVFALDMSGDISKWWILFLWLITLLAVLSLPYLWFGSAEVQAWNYHTRRTLPALRPPPVQPTPATSRNT